MAEDTAGEHPASFSPFSLRQVPSSVSLLRSPFSTPSIRVPSLFVPLRHFGLKVKQEFGRFSETLSKRERDGKGHTEVITSAGRMDEGNIPRGVRVPL